MTLQHIEAQKAARYVGNYSEKQAQRRALDEMLKGYKGTITELPGPNFIHTFDMIRSINSVIAPFTC